MFSVKSYSSELLHDWDRVLKNSINGTLLHSWTFMEYHGDRFNDASLIIYKKDEPVGVFPAHQLEQAIYSHQGLTYGGLIVKTGLRMIENVLVLKAVLRHYHKIEIANVVIKAIPSFYGSASQEWMSYCMFLLEAENFRTDLSFAIPLPASPRIYSKGRRWGINKAKKNSLTICEVKDLQPFWDKVLKPNLWQKHQVKPVHTLAEIQQLATINAPLIRQFDVLEQGEPVAGITIFETQTTAHAQYIASTSRGRALSALDLLINHMVEEVFSHKSFFDFGTVNENEGRQINRGLMEWKESFGAQPYVHQFYKVDPGRFGRLEGGMN